MKAYKGELIIINHLSSDKPGPEPTSWYLEPELLGFRGLGFRVQGLGLGWEFRFQGLGLARGLGFICRRHVDGYRPGYVMPRGYSEQI